MVKTESSEESLLLSFLGSYEDVETLIKSVQQIQRRSEALEQELRKHEQKPAARFAYILLFCGVFILALSVVFASNILESVGLALDIEANILAFIGLGLTLWGGLFRFVKPSKYVRRDVVDYATISSLKTIDKMITDLDLQGNAIYFPSTIFDKNSRGVLAFIPTTKDLTPLSIGEVAEDKIFLEKGICLIPPGLGLVNLFERELGVDFSDVDLQYLNYNLSKLLIDGLEIAEGFEINVELFSNLVHVKIVGSIYGDLCSKVMDLNSVCPRLGCPLCSSVACILAKVTGKPIIIERKEILYFPPRIIEAWYRVIQDYKIPV